MRPDCGPFKNLSQKLILKTYPKKTCQNKYKSYLHRHLTLSIRMAEKGEVMSISSHPTQYILSCCCNQEANIGMGKPCIVVSNYAVAITLELSDFHLCTNNRQCLFLIFVWISLCFPYFGWDGTGSMIVILLLHYAISDATATTSDPSRMLI